MKTSELIDEKIVHKVYGQGRAKAEAARNRMFIGS